MVLDTVLPRMPKRKSRPKGPKSEDAKTVRIEKDAFAILQNEEGRTGTTKQAVASRLVRWYAKQNNTVRAEILNPEGYPNELIASEVAQVLDAMQFRDFSNIRAGQAIGLIKVLLEVVDKIIATQNIVISEMSNIKTHELEDK